MHANVMLLKPLRRIRKEAKSDDHCIRFQHPLRARDGLGDATAARIWRSEARLNDLHALDGVRADDLGRLRIEEELHTLLLAVLVVAARARHVELIATVGARH